VADIGALYVRILADVKQFGADLKAKMSGASSEAEASGKKVGGSFGKGLAAASAALAGVAVIKYLHDAGEAASELQADMHKTESVFGSAGKGVLTWSSKSAAALGMSQDQSLTLATSMGNLYKSYGLSSKGAAQLSERSISLGNDLATFYKKDPAAGVNAIRLASAGAYRGLKQFGIVIDKNAVTAQALSMHLGTTTVDTNKLAKAQIAADKAQITYNAAVKKHGQNSVEARKAQLGLAAAQINVNKALQGGKTTLTAAEKAQATYALVAKRAGAAQGAFAKEGGTLEVQQRKTAAQFANMKAQLGTALLPVFTKVGNIIATQVAPAFASMAGWLAKNSSWLTPLVGTLTAFALAVLAVNKAMKLVKAAQEAWQAVMKIGQAITRAFAAANYLLDAAINANPLTLIIVGIVAFVAVLVIAYMKVSWFHNLVQTVFGWIVSHWPLLLAVLTGPIGLAVVLIIQHWNTIWTFVTGVVTAIINWLRKNWMLIVGIILGPIALAAALVWRYWSQVQAITSAVWNAVLGIIRSVIGAIVGAVSGMVGAVIGFFSRLPGALIGFGSSMMQGFLSGITAGWGAVSGWLGGIPGRALSAVGSLASTLYYVGVDLVMGLVNGIAGAWHFVTDKISSLVGTIAAPVKKLLGIGSPSRVMADQVGQWISKGIASGITEHGAAVHKAMAGLPLDVYAAGGAGGPVSAGAAARRSAPTVGTMYVQALDARQLAHAVSDRLAYAELRGQTL
jgi:phage-related protein